MTTFILIPYKDRYCLGLLSEKDFIEYCLLLNLPIPANRYYGKCYITKNAVTYYINISPAFAQIYYNNKLYISGVLRLTKTI